MTALKPNTDKPNILVLRGGHSQYSSAVLMAGGNPITVDPTQLADLDETLNTHRIHGVLLCGGSDLDPRLYDEKPHKKVYGVDEIRDMAEMTVLDEARHWDIPVLGVCRGLQMINVEAGGSLRQHIGDSHWGVVHPVRTSGLLRSTVKAQNIKIRSYHHQAIKRVAEGFAVVGREDKTIEAITDGRCLGVQFHPEMEPRAPYSRRIFSWLATEAARRAGLPSPRVALVPTAPAPAPTKKRRARRASSASGTSDLKTSYFCPTCMVQFDKRVDHRDHILHIHPLPKKQALKLR